MMLYFVFINFIFILIISDSWCRNIEKTIVPIGESFSFNCHQDESVYFARQLHDWSEIQNNDNRYSYLNLNIININEENVLRITINSANSQNTGYYGCSSSKSRRQSMSRTYQLIVADVDLFYWSYICHGQPGACMTFNDPSDETRSTFEVADQTYVDLFCCTSVTGYEHVNIKMTPVGEIRDRITIKRNQELDGSWVVCANQHTVFKRTSSRYPERLTCELVIDNRVHSSLISVIDIKDAMPINPDIDPSNRFTPPSKDDDDEYFNGRTSSNSGRRGKLTTGKQIAIIIGSIIGGLFFFGLLFFLIFFLCCKNRVLKNSSSQTKKSNKDPIVSTHVKSNKKEKQNPQEEEPLYLEPVPLSENSPVFLRL
ncbi:unnamed protein product [Rotaria sordida]|uniref:Ig-like domain-containing protein n=1 Tax=Rotaria sordida TaxID=392033 RepID=A0A815RU20_9BILA|nr:unnamed protein product [Rotaria sordida]CAF1481558.1 unnamed protein product [Rotaria sordida]